MPGKSGFYHEVLDSITETKFYNNGFLIRTYRYPTIEKKFTSPLINYDNLNLITDNTYSLDNMNPVINGTKPMTEVLFKVDNNNCKCCKKCKKAVNEIVNSIDVNKFALNIHLCKYENHVHSMIISTNKPFNELFDTNVFMEDYLSYMDASTQLAQLEDDEEDFREFSEDEKDAFKYVFNDTFSTKEVKNPGGFIEFDFLQPKHESELILAGLLQGHPLEITFSLLAGNYLHSTD
jgi:hypothetical protein